MPVLPVRADGASTLRPAALARFISFLLLALVLTGCFGGGGSGKILYVVGAATPSVALLKVSSSGALTASSTVASGASPDAILIAPNRKFAYVADSAGTTVAGGVSQYTLNGSGTLTPVTQTVNSTTITTTTAPAVKAGINPVALAVDQNTQFLFVANQTSNNISAYTIDPPTGALTEVSGSPFSTAAGPSSLATAGSVLFVANQGAGQVSAYTFDSKTGALTAAGGSPVAAGVSPRSLGVDPSGKFLYVADASANTVLAFNIQTGGQLSAISGAGVATGAMPANVLVHSSGKFLYVANQGAGTVSVFSIGSSGALTAISGSPYAVGTSPVYVATDSSGKFLFVANQGSNDISVFTINGSDGSLATASNSPFAVSAVTSPVALASIN